MKVKRDVLRTLVDIRIEAEWEDADPKLELEDEENKAWVCQQIGVGNIWAWCGVAVIAEFHGFEARDYLGHCSYVNEAAFKADGYYEDMVNMCIKEIAEEIEKIMGIHDLWDHDAASCLWCVAT